MKGATFQLWESPYSHKARVGVTRHSHENCERVMASRPEEIPFEEPSGEPPLEPSPFTEPCPPETPRRPSEPAPFPCPPEFPSEIASAKCAKIDR